MWENRNPLSQLEYLTNHAADALHQGSFCMSKFETTAPRDFELIFYFGSLSSVLSHLGGCEMFLINSWRRIQQDRVLQQLWASNSLPGICLTCCLFCMTIKLKVEERKKQKTAPKSGWIPDLLEWPMCYSYLITLKLLWLQLRAALGASAHVQSHALKSVDLLTLLLPCWVLWLWGGGPRDLVEGVGAPLQAAPECPAPCASIGEEREHLVPILCQRAENRQGTCLIMCFTLK